MCIKVMKCSDYTLKEDKFKAPKKGQAESTHSIENYLGKRTTSSNDKFEQLVLKLSFILVVPLY